jgi:hypothetical protein
MTQAAFEAKLCYIRDSWAWFTTADLKDQWGDDWDDCAADDNAGSPYGWDPHRKCPEYAIFKLAWEGPFESAGSQYSVEAINRGDAAWLHPSLWGPGDEKKTRPIPAGATMAQFIEAVEAAGGVVYLPREAD